DGVAAAQTVLAHHVHRDVDVVGSGQVARGPDERVVVQHVEDARDRLYDVILAQFGLAAALTGTLAAAPTVTETTSAPTVPAVVVIIGVVGVAAAVLVAAALLIPTVLLIPAVLVAAVLLVTTAVLL